MPTNKYWSDIVSELDPYVPGEQPKLSNLVKLNTNENPYGPSPKVLDAISASLGDELRLYPDPNADLLKQAIARFYSLNTNQVFVGNGSDEVLAHIFQALLKHKQPILFPDITYSFYPVYCGLYQVPFELVPLAEDLTDEAYIDFGGESAIALVDRYPNLLVTQTLSKSRSLAGLRVGFAVGQSSLIEALERVKNSFNSYPLDQLAIAGGVAAFEDEAYFKQVCQAVIDSRGQLVSELSALGFQVLPSAANFLFVSHPQCDAAELLAGLREQGIIVRHFKQHRIDQYLRITIGLPEQNRRLLDVLAGLLGCL